MAGAAAHYSCANCVAASFPSSFVQTAVSHVSSFLRRIERALQDGHEILFTRAREDKTEIPFDVSGSSVALDG
jgi:hypothetical protein